MAFQPHTENEAYLFLLEGHLRPFIRNLRQLPADKWDWTPDIAAPTPRILATHAWQWLQCDRHHIADPNASQHPAILEPPDDPQELCNALEEETNRWHTLLAEMKPEQWDEERTQFNNSFPMNIRAFVCHIIQNTIYKHGQFSTLFFALGLDGTEAYTAPFPGPIYAQLAEKEKQAQAQAHSSS